VRDIVLKPGERWSNDASLEENSRGGSRACSSDRNRRPWGFTFERRCRRSAPAERACQRMRLSNPLLELPGHGLL